jgi:nitrite reductase (NADH) large subunit
MGNQVPRRHRTKQAEKPDELRTGNAMNSTDTSTDPQRLIIIGNGMVGHHCVEQLIERGALAQYCVQVFSEESLRAYDRVHLSEYFTGRDAESLALSSAELYQTPGVTLHLGVAVLEIDRQRREVITAEGRFPYDQLVLSIALWPISTPFRPPPRTRAVVWWSAVVCSVWRRPMR